MLPALRMTIAARLILPDERMPASPASMKPVGAISDVAGRRALDSLQHADAAAGGQARGIEDAGTGLRIDQEEFSEKRYNNGRGKPAFRSAVSKSAVSKRGGTTTTSLHEGNRGGPCRANFQASSRTHSLQRRASKQLFGAVIWQDGRWPSTWSGVLLIRVASMRFSYFSSSVVFWVRARSISAELRSNSKERCRLEADCLRIGTGS